MQKTRQRSREQGRELKAAGTAGNAENRTEEQRTAQGKQNTRESIPLFVA